MKNLLCQVKSPFYFVIYENLSAAKLQKGPKQPPAQLSRQPFRMPLNAPDGKAIMTQGLHGAVLRPLDGPQPSAQTGNGLVMGAVHPAGRPPSRARALPSSFPRPTD